MSDGQTQKITRYSNVTATTEVGHSDFDVDAYGRLEGIDHETPANVVLTGYDYAYDRLNRLTAAVARNEDRLLKLFRITSLDKFFAIHASRAALFEGIGPDEGDPLPEDQDQGQPA